MTSSPSSASKVPIPISPFSFKSAMLSNPLKFPTRSDSIVET